MVEKHSKQVHLDAGQTVSEAFQAVLGHNLAYLAHWEPAARSWEDIEGVHQTRVAFRRLRSALSIFRPAVPAEVSAIWSEGMRELATRLGQARDLDVFLTETLPRTREAISQPSAHKLEALAQAHRMDAYQEVRAMWDGDAYARFRVDFSHWIETRGWELGPLDNKARRRLAGSLTPFACKVLERIERRVLKAGAEVDKRVPEEMHQLRIRCKKMRYAAEFFAPLFVGMDHFIHHMRGLQDLLGVLNDFSVTEGLVGRVLAGTSDPELLAQTGALTAWQARQRRVLLDGFERHWHEFAKARDPWHHKAAQVPAAKAPLEVAV